MKKSINIKKNKIGYYNFKKIPHPEELKKYYKEKYFSKNISYKDKLLSSEKLYLKVHALIKIFMIKKLLKRNLRNLSILDIGAGTGRFLFDVKNYFKNHLGVDYSANNLEKFIKNKINFQENDPKIFIKDNIKEFDIITLNNVLEHVPDVDFFLKNLFLNTKKSTLFLITVPNDFSFLQKITNKVVKKKNYWLAPPEHLNYFNNYNFKNFAKSKNFKILDAISDFPVELFLLIKQFDYTKDKKLGKNIHLLRCEITNYLFKNYELNKLYQIFKSLNELHIGRNNIYLIKKM
jgi:2-polyprenyl-3-methyl-5-hydroxy-6-metoxy-1,4-benzoquinol methylase